MPNLIEALKNFPKKKVLVLGDIMLDIFSWGEVTRVNPEQPAASLVAMLKETYALGGAANVANNLSSLGARTTLFALLGEDQNKNRLTDLCKSNGIVFDSLQSSFPNIVKQRVMAHGQQMVRLDYGEKELQEIDTSTESQAIDYLRKNLFNYDVIILSDYDKRFFTENLSQEIIKLSNSLSIPTLIDPKPINAYYFRGGTLISPNKKEAEEISGIKYSNGEKTLRTMASSLRDKLQVPYVVITCGEDGAYSYHNGDSRLVKTVAKQVADVTGAGDTFAATLALGFSSGLGIHDAALLGSYAAGIVVEKLGTATLTLQELESLL